MLMVTKTAPNSCGLWRIPDSAFLPTLLRKFRIRSCHNRCRQRGCSLQPRPCPCPCRRPYCRSRSAAGCRSRRNVAAVRRFVVVAFGTRRWVVERAVRAVVSRTSAAWTFAVSRWLGQAVGRVWCLTVRAMRRDGCVARRRVSVACFLHAISTPFICGEISGDIPCIARSSARSSRNLLRVRLPQSPLFTRLALAKSQPLCRAEESTSICMDPWKLWGNGMGDCVPGVETAPKLETESGESSAERLRLQLMLFGRVG
jgi:hypothetical protein